MRRKIVVLLILITIFTLGCSPVKKAYYSNHFENEETRFQHHSGFALYDLEEEKFIYEHNANKYFTPASNTKILTLFGAVNILGDSIPALEYLVKGDSLIFWGTGDPSFLNPNVYYDSSVWLFLKNSEKNLFYSSANYHNTHFGDGWMWDDFHEDAPERSPFPIYGNMVVTETLDSGKLIQFGSPYFNQHIKLDSINAYSKTIARIVQNNQLEYIDRNPSTTYNVPFRFSDVLIAQLLTDTLKRPVTAIKLQKNIEEQKIYSIPVDSVYKVMMQESDNFLAEQLLLLCSNAVSDTINTEIAINYIKDTLLFDLPDQPIWRDGSGLSRYNLVTPQSIIKLWQKLYVIMGPERLFNILAAGGESGTLRNYYKAETPYIFAKTGTLSNNHNLSGFLVAKSGKILVFSYMNNNYPVSSSKVKPGMEKLLKEIYENY